MRPNTSNRTSKENMLYKLAYELPWKTVYVQKYLLQRSLMDEKNTVEINPFFTVVYDWSTQCARALLLYFL